MKSHRFNLFVMLAGFVFASFWGDSNATIIQAQELSKIDFPTLQEGDWPWWRGPSRQGHDFRHSIPLRFSDLRNAEWKTPLPGRGHSSPIVIGDRVYLTTSMDTEQEQWIIALDAIRGEIQWKKMMNQGGYPKVNHPKNTEATSSLASDGERLYSVLLHHDKIFLYCLTMTGEMAWSKEVGTYEPQKYQYGYAPSPILYRDTVIVTYEYDGPSGLVAYDRVTGEESWRTLRKPACTYSSPTIATIAGRDQLLISGGDLIAAYDPDNGKELWSTEGTTEVTCGTMVWDGNIVFASGGYPKSETIALDAANRGRVLWRNDQKCYEQSMLAYQGYLYALTSKGVMFCWRATDGQEMWKERLRGPVSASPVLVGNHILWANEAGQHYVVQATPEKFELIAENELGDEAFASPAISKNRLFLRVASIGNANRQEYLYCFRDLEKEGQ